MPLFLVVVAIFALRLVDVSMGTLRIVFLVQGRTRLAGATAFFESLVWTVAAILVLNNLDSPWKILAYAGGYAAGTMLGGMVEQKIGLGNRLVRIVSPVDSPQTYPRLHEEGYPVTVMNGEGRDGEVRISFTFVPRKEVPSVMAMVREVNPNAFVMVEDSTLANGSDNWHRAATALRK
ncbi:MAG: DUF2179 domain-containing protein [Acidimicrobiia bacterium]|nr:DUF2179 domain-containing protein [Acidimicrobiia bacterium]